MNSNKIAFAEAINTATIQAMELEKNVFVFGIGVDKHGNIFEQQITLKKSLDLREFLILHLQNKL